MKKQNPSDTKLALKWACDERTIRRWRKDRAPLNDPKRMRRWLAGRKHLPPGTVALLEQLRTDERATVASQDAKPQVEGAAGALKRLEAAEAQAYTAFKNATATGDDIAIKSSRENWLKISESLRRFDIALEENRRDSGELVRRAEVELALRKLGWIMRVAHEGIIPQIAVAVAGESDIVRTRVILRKIGYDVALLSYSAAEALGAPSWAIRAVAADIVAETYATHDQIEHLTKFIQEKISKCVEDRTTAQ